MALPIQCYNVLKKSTSPEAICYLSEKGRKDLIRYLEIVDDVCDTFQEDKNFFITNTPMSALRPLFKFKKDSDVYRTAIGQIHMAHQSKHSVTAPVVKTYMGIKPIEPKAAPVVKSDGVAKIINDNPRSSSVSKDNSYLLSILKPPQIAILQEIMKKENCDNEYAAMIKALIWAKERMKKK
jgi:hypothetical protein